MPGVDHRSTPSPVDPEERVSHWITKGFLALIGVSFTLLLSFGSWLVVSINQINNSTSILQTEFASYKADITDLKASVDHLRIRGESWATKDALSLTKDSLRDDLIKVKDQVSSLELRVTRIEAGAK